MIAEDSFIVVCLGYQLGDPGGVCYELMQAPPHEIRMTTHELKEAGEFPFGSQRRAISLVQIRNLSGGEILQCQTRSNVERRLVHIRNEKMRLSRVGDRQGESIPRTGWVERARVME